MVMVALHEVGLVGSAVPQPESVAAKAAHTRLDNTPIFNANS